MLALVAFWMLVAAQPLRYCRLTAHYLHHHQNAATSNKGKEKINNRKIKHVELEGFLLDSISTVAKSKIFLFHIEMDHY